MMETPYVRVFTKQFKVEDDMSKIQADLAKRAETMGLNMIDGVFCCNYHHTTQSCVMVLTITPSSPPGSTHADHKADSTPTPGAESTIINSVESNHTGLPATWQCPGSYHRHGL